MAQTVLIVEDDEKIVHLLRLYLEREGFAVSSAADDAAGVETVSRLRPDRSARARSSRASAPSSAAPPASFLSACSAGAGWRWI